MTSIDDLYHAHYRRLYRVGYSVTKDRYLAEDVVQEAFIKAMEHLESIRDEKKILPWLTVVTRRIAIDSIRSDRRKKVIPMEQEMLMNLGKELNQTIEKEIELSWLFEVAYDRILNLNHIYRDVMILKVKHDLKEREIANRLNVKLSLVKTRIHRARRYLKEDFQKKVSA